MKKRNKNQLPNSDMPVMQPLPMQKGDAHRCWMIVKDWELNCKPLGIIFFIPKGFIFNGASVPRVFSNIFPATGYLFLGALVHDYMYGYAAYKCVVPEAEDKISWRNNIQMPQVKRVEADKEKSDDIFKAISNWLYKDHWIKTGLATAALRMGGQGAWDECRKIDGTYQAPPIYQEINNDIENG